MRTALRGKAAQLITMDFVGFDEWLLERMQERGVSRTELIRRLSRPGETDQRGNVYLWLQGRRVPRYDKCQLIGDALGIPHKDVLAAAGYNGEDPRVEDHPGDQLTPAEMATLRAFLAAVGTLSPDDLKHVAKLARALIQANKDDS